MRKITNIRTILWKIMTLGVTVTRTTQIWPGDDRARFDFSFKGVDLGGIVIDPRGIILDGNTVFFDTGDPRIFWTGNDIVDWISGVVDTINDDDDFDDWDPDW